MDRKGSKHAPRPRRWKLETFCVRHACLHARCCVFSTPTMTLTTLVAARLEPDLTSRARSSPIDRHSHSSTPPLLQPSQITFNSSAPKPRRPETKKFFGRMCTHPQNPRDTTKRKPTAAGLLLVVNLKLKVICCSCCWRTTNITLCSWIG